MAARQLRERLGDTQQAFAYRLGVSISAITNYERGRIPTGRSLIEMMFIADMHGHADLAKAFLDEISDQLGYRIPLPGHTRTLVLLPGEKARLNAVVALMRGGKRFEHALAELDRLLGPVIEECQANDHSGSRGLELAQEVLRRIDMGQAEEEIATTLNCTAEQIEKLEDDALLFERRRFGSKGRRE